MQTTNDSQPRKVAEFIPPGLCRQPSNERQENYKATGFSPAGLSLQPTKDTSIREFGRTKLTLRSDLIFTPRTFGGESCYTIEDVVNSKFYRIGIPEYTFVSLLDGHTSVNQALALASRAHPDSALTEDEAAVICKWLVESELAATPESSRPGRLVENAQKAAADRTLRKWNPALVRVPLFHPDRFFQVVSPWVSWLFAQSTFVPWLLLIGVAAYQVLSRWDRFVASSDRIFAANNWLWLGLCWIVLKLGHEFSHGAVCKRYGGTVRETGLIFIMMAPVAYVDVTASWRFRSKWQRIHTASAGIYMELLFAAIAAFVWSSTEPGPLNMMCFNAVVMASFTTVLFNANPLMKYDGYYVLSDLLDIPNLYATGQHYLQYWGRRYLLGVEGSPPRCSESKRFLVQCYGIASLVWRIVFSLGLVLVAATFFHGAGIILSCIAGALWLGWPALRFVQYLVHGTETERPHPTRFFCIMGLVAAAILLVLAIPWPGVTHAPAVVEYSPLTAVRTGCSGFVRELFVQPGDLVEEGQVLAQLENEELASELADLSLAQQQSQLKLRSLEKKGHMAAYQAELDNLKALEKKHEEKKSQADQLTVRAPCRGTVIGRNLDTWLGRYAKAGTEIVSIGNESTLELRLSIAQEDLDVFKVHLEKSIRTRLPGQRPFYCLLERVHPSAATDLPYAALAAPNGGPLTVRAKDHASDSSDPARSNAAQFEFLSPRFTGIMYPDAAHCRSLHPGQLGVATIRPYCESIGGHLYRAISHWAEQKLSSRQ